MSAVAMGFCATHLRFPGYLIFRDGSIISLIGRESRKLSPGGRPYLSVQLRDAEGVFQSIRVHRLMAETFHGAPPPDREVRHLDGIKKNNDATNILWGTRVENARDRDIHGAHAKGERHVNAKLTDADVRQIRQLCGRGRRQNVVASQFGVSPITVSRIINNKRWRHLNV